MKRVSFKIAKVLKDTGYPQNKNDKTVLYPTVGEFKGMLCTYNSDAPERDKYSINAPTYLEVWLWLCKHSIPINVTYDCVRKRYVAKFNANDYFIGEDPEKAIIASIEYLFDNDLIK